ncbi:hypothetical protein BZG36_03806 [Bifiguratus adelaidae]|uniref:H/ACA ribonucleoprotein complex non-core subunit NAF1 n=1 Tax=Bifiguratus adelaidae TaxID=1938954 RepID=A0A261XWY2_9FUNG|nr:hypothetical protein BZG36_03806 [Bifiguratus adelaidae]
MLASEQNAPTNEEVAEISHGQVKTEAASTEATLTVQSESSDTSAPAKEDTSAEIPEPMAASEATSTDNADSILDAAIAGAMGSNDAEEKHASGTERNTEASENESDSDESSSDTDSSSSDDSEAQPVSPQDREKALHEYDSNDEEGGAPSGPIRSQHEIDQIEIVKPQISIAPDAPLVHAGAIYSVVENVIVVQGLLDGEVQVLDSGSVFVYSDREVMGEVFETFGPVRRPMYSVRYNDAKYTKFTQTRTLDVKGSDASNVYDEEVGEDEMEFSDDEKEAEHKRGIKQAKRKKAKRDPQADNAGTNGFGDYTILPRPDRQAQPNPPPQTQQPQQRPQPHHSAYYSSSNSHATTAPHQAYQASPAQNQTPYTSHWPSHQQQPQYAPYNYPQQPQQLQPPTYTMPTDIPSLIQAVQHTLSQQTYAPSQSYAQPHPYEHRQPYPPQQNPSSHVQQQSYPAISLFQGGPPPLHMPNGQQQYQQPWTGRGRGRGNRYQGYPQ